jgi:hypothetical protein
MPAILVFIVIVAIFAGASIYRDSPWTNNLFKKMQCIIDNKKCPHENRDQPDTETERERENLEPTSK